jgi:hypothetical protein
MYSKLISNSQREMLKFEKRKIDSWYYHTLQVPMCSFVKIRELIVYNFMDKTPLCEVMSLDSPSPFFLYIFLISVVDSDPDSQSGTGSGSRRPKNDPQK